MRAVAWRTVPREYCRPRTDLLSRKLLLVRLLGECTSARDRQNPSNYNRTFHEDDSNRRLQNGGAGVPRATRSFLLQNPFYCISANVHTDPPCGTCFNASRAAFQ